MTLIRVDPSTLHRSSQRVNGVSQGTNASGGELYHATQGVPSYDGQFGPSVILISAEADARAKALANRLAELSGWLQERASAFEAADAAGVEHYRAATAGLPLWDSDLLVRWAEWLRIPIQWLERYLRLGGFLLPGWIPPSLAVAVIPSFGGLAWRGRLFVGMARPSWWPRGWRWPFGPKTVPPTTDPPVVETPPPGPKPIRGQQVPAGIGQNGKFPRNAYGDKITSNCTWYAAAAVKAAGGIDLNDKRSPRLGNGGEWAANAKKIKGQPNSPVRDVNGIPAVGTVYTHSKGNHVAFVEEVRFVQDGNGVSKFEIVVSEENAGFMGKDGKYHGMGEPVRQPAEKIEVADDPNGEVYRYRRTITLQAKPGTNPPQVDSASGVEFIHFNYD